MIKDFSPINVVIISSYPPCKCGIATYTYHLQKAFKYNNLAINISIITPIAREDKNIIYPEEVTNFIVKNKREQYGKIANYINKSEADLVLLQHEFGLFGGRDGEYIIEILKNIKIPLVSYLHTTPIMGKVENKSHKIKILKEIAKLSQKVIVPAEIALRKMVVEYGFKKNKLQCIRHGTPAVDYVKQDVARKQLGVKEKKIISSVGLINLCKGIDLIVESLPFIVKKHNNVFYYIVGKVHPGKKKEADKFLKRIWARASELNVSKHIKRVDEYLTDKKLIKYFQASDIYLTPYSRSEQVSSGTLAYAFACGRCVVSTSYIYAKELIGENERGLLVNYNDPKDIAEKVIYILDNPKKQKEIERRAYKLGQETSWEQVTIKHLEIFKEILKK